MNYEDDTVGYRCHQNAVGKRSDGWRVDHYMIERATEIEHNLAHLIEPSNSAGLGGDGPAVSKIQPALFLLLDEGYHFGLVHLV